MLSLSIENDRLASVLSSGIWNHWLTNARRIDEEKANAISSIVEDISRRKRSLALWVIEAIIDFDALEFLPACFNILTPPRSFEKFVLPACMKKLALIEDRDMRVGFGEIVLMFLSPGTKCFFGKSVDVELLGERWHVKKIRKKDRRARMGGALATCYSSSSIALRLSTHDPQFSQVINNKNLQINEEAIVSEFGTMDDFWKKFRNEFVEREFSNVSGVCFFDEDSSTVEFHRKHDIELVGATQGKYRIRAKRTD